MGQGATECDSRTHQGSKKNRVASGTSKHAEKTAVSNDRSGRKDRKI
jgi:hypothetical protein